MTEKVDNIEELEEEVLEQEDEIVEDTMEEIIEEEKIIELRDSLARLQADFTNYRRRTEKEKSDYLDLGASKIIIDLLPIVDNFERALETEEKGPFYEGVEMIYTQIKSLLEKNGVFEMDALDKEFDPNFHHAVFAEEVEGKDADVVTDVLQKGYIMNEKVLRPAMVKVSK